MTAVQAVVRPLFCLVALGGLAYVLGFRSGVLATMVAGSVYLTAGLLALCIASFFAKMRTLLRLRVLLIAAVFVGSIALLTFSAGYTEFGQSGDDVLVSQGQITLMGSAGIVEAAVVNAGLTGLAVLTAAAIEWLFARLMRAR